MAKNLESDLNFGIALLRVKEGDEVARASWEKGWYLVLQVAQDADGADVILKVEPNGDKAEWKPTHEDLLAEDWEVTKEAE